MERIQLRHCCYTDNQLCFKCFSCNSTVEISQYLSNSWALNYTIWWEMFRFILRSLRHCWDLFWKGRHESTGVFFSDLRRLWKPLNTFGCQTYSALRPGWKYILRTRVLFMNWGMLSHMYYVVNLMNSLHFMLARTMVCCSMF